MRVLGPEKQWMEVLTSYPPDKRIEGKLRDGGLVQVSVLDVPSNFRWPKAGEVWSIVRDPIDNVTWNLCSRVNGWNPVESNGSVSRTEIEGLDISNMAAGEMRLDSDRIYDSRGYRVAPVDLSDIDNGETLVWNEADQVLIPGVAPTPGGGTAELVIVNVTRSTNTTVPAGYGKVPFDVEVADSHGFYDLATKRFQPTLAGWYQVTTETSIGSVATGQGTWTYVIKNSTGGNYPTTGTQLAIDGRYAATAGEIIAANPVVTVYMNGTTDFLEIWYWGWSPNTWTLAGTSSNNPAFLAITSVGGPSGADGNTVLSGVGVPSAALGKNGDFYINTGTNTLYGPKAAGAWPAGVTLVGPTGPQGPQGIQGIQGIQGLSVLNGTADPTTQGLNGEFYINTATWKIFGPKAGGVWPAGTNLIGPQGPAGADGTAGATGPPGPGVPTGGTTGQALVKVDATDYNTTWGASGHVILDEGVPETTRPNLDFQGAGVSVSDDVSNSKTIVTIPGGGGGSALGGAQYTTTIGDGTARTFTVTHALGTRNVQVSVYQTASPYQDVTGGLEYEHASVDQVIIRTSTSLAPLALGEYTVVVSGPGAALTEQSMDPWHSVGVAGEPAFSAGVSNNGAQGLQFRKAPDGKVLIRGLVNTPSGAGPLFTLPVGYRPPTDHVRFMAPDVTSGAATQLYVSANGTVNKISGPILVDASVIQFDTDTVTTLPAGPPGTSGNSWSAVIGDGTSKTFTLTHGMGTRSVNVAAYQTASPYSEVEIEVERTSPNVVTVKTAAGLAAPTAGQYTVVITGPGAAVESQTIDAWHDFSGIGGDGGFLNSSVHFDNNSVTPSTTVGHRNLGYRKYPDGKVRLRGFLKAGVSGAVALLLPPGYRPPAARIFLGLANGGFAYIEVKTDGGVYPTNQTGVVTSWIGLDEVEFDTEVITTLPAGPPGGLSYTQAFGDGINRVFTVPHNLRTWNVNVTVRETNAPRAIVPAEIEYTDQNTLTIRTSTALAAPTSGQYTVVVNGPGAAITSQTIEGWHTVGAAGEPTFSAGWSALAGTGSVQFRKDPLGTVWLRGFAGKSTAVVAGDAIFTLPVGYGPTQNAYFGTYENGATGTVGAVYVSTSRQVSAGSAGTGISLSDIHFDTDTVTTLPAGPAGPTGPPGPATGTAIPKVSTLPIVGLTDGYEIYYQNAAMATAGVRWHLVYNVSAGTYKWEFVGGRPLEFEIVTAEGRSGTAYGDLTTVGPSVIAPLAGDYDIKVQSTFHIPAGSTAGSVALAAPKLGAAATSDNDYISFSAYTGGTTTQGASVSREMRRTLAAGDTVRMQYKGTDALTYTWSRRHLTIIPVRVI